VLDRRRTGREHLLLQLQQLDGGHHLADQDQPRAAHLRDPEDHRRADDHRQRQRIRQRRTEAERGRHRDLFTSDHGDVRAPGGAGRSAVLAGQAGVGQHPPLPLDCCFGFVVQQQFDRMNHRVPSREG